MQLFALMCSYFRQELDLAVDRVANRVTALVKEAHNGPTASVLKRLRTAKGAVLTLENRHIRQISKVCVPYPTRLHRTCVLLSG